MSEPHASFETLLLYLKESRGFDFTGYKRPSLTRRVDHRMAEVGAGDYAEYLEYLEMHPEEFTALFNTILINVTSFFRDPEAWEYLRAEILPRHAGGQGAGRADPGVERRLRLRARRRTRWRSFWPRRSASRSSGERVKIYATDVDEEALTQARQATYDERRGRAPSRPSCWNATSIRSAAGTSSTRICGARSSSVATIWCRTRRSRGWTCWCAATR